MIHVVRNFLKMTYKFKHSANIEQYLTNEMSPSERIAFEQELKSNPDLAKEFELSQSIDSALERDDIIDLRRKLGNAMHPGQTVVKEVPVVHIQSMKWWYAVAMLVTLLTVSAIIYFQTPKGNLNDTLFSEYYTSENIIDQTRGDENIVEAVVKFQQKDFRAASMLFKCVLDADNSNIAVRFYYGISNIETGNYDNSIKAFTAIINQSDNLYIEHAHWYLGLCYLKNNQKAEAISQFNIIAFDPDNFHCLEAKSILEVLRDK